MNEQAGASITDVRSQAAYSFLFFVIFVYDTCSLAKIFRVLACLLPLSQSHKTAVLAGTPQVLGLTLSCLGSCTSVHVAVGMTMSNVGKPCGPTELKWAQMPAEQMACE